jgi:hypothetical protein
MQLKDFIRGIFPNRKTQPGREALPGLYQTGCVKAMPFVPSLDITYDLTAPECEVCGNRSEYNLKMMLTKGPNGFYIMNYSPVDYARHVVCLKCLDDSITLVEEYGHRPLRDMPLYIGDGNPFLKELALMRLKEGS